MGAAWWALHSSIQYFGCLRKGNIAYDIFHEGKAVDGGLWVGSKKRQEK
jgi:hypothetical protein